MMAAGRGAVPMRSPASLRVHPSSANAAFSSSSAPPIFRVLCKGTVITDEVVADEDPGGVPVPVPVPMLAVAVCEPQGKVVLRGRKPVLGFVAGHDGDDDGQVLLEAMAIVEGLHTAIRMGITSLEAITDHRLLHNYMLGLSRPTGEKLADIINMALSVRKQFEQCEISLVKQGQVDNMVNSKLANEGLDVEIARYLAMKEKRESCKICLSDVDTAKIHAVEGCSHRFCLPCMKKHMEVMLIRGMAPRCPHLGCTTRLTVEEGAKALLPSRLLEMMVQRMQEEHIHPSQRIYCPYAKCSALMSLSELVGSAEYNNTSTTLRKCVKCGGPICVKCRVAWHERMSCLEYQRQYPHGDVECEMLHKLAKRRFWKQCERCNHMIEHATGCAYITCVCGNHFCYICGETLADGGCACTRLQLQHRRRRRCFPLLACWRG